MEQALYGSNENEALQARRFLEAGNEAYLRHISPYQSAPSLDEALNQYARGIELDPKNADLMVATGKALFHQGSYEKAEQWAKRALEQDVRQPEAYTILGRTAHKMANHEEAISRLKRSLRPMGSAKTRLQLFRILRDYARPDLAKSGWKNFTRLSQAFYYLLGGITLLPFERERLDLKGLYRLLPAIVKAHIGEIRKDFKAALEIYLRLHEAFPGMANLMLAIADLYSKTNAPGEAVYWYKKCLARHPGHEDARYRFAQHLETMQRNEEAAELYEDLIAARPKDAFLYCHLGNVHYALQNYAQSLEFYKASLHLGLCQGESPKWRALLAQSIGNLHAEFLNNPAAAETAYLMAIDLDPTEVDNYIQLGLLYFQGEDYGNARLLYESATQIAPSNAKLYSNLGYLCWISNDLDSAIPYYNKAIELNPAYDIPHNNLGVIYLDAVGDVYKAVELLEKTIELNENYALAYYNLGRAYSFINQPSKAANCFQMAQKLNRYTCELDNEELDARISYLFTTQPQQEAS